MTTFRGAVASSDVKSLSQISGVGKKTAERIVVELRDKIGAAGAWEAASAKHSLSPDDQKINDAVLALMALGFKQIEAHDSVRAAQTMLGAKATVEQLVRACLKKGADADVNPSPKCRSRNRGVVVPHTPKWHQRLRRVGDLCLDPHGFGHVALSVERPLRILSLRRYPAGDLLRLAQPARAFDDGIFQLCEKHNHTPGLAAMVSASKDGGFLAGILECFNVQPVRGSSSRRGPQALLELTTWAERGYDLAITPDGPRGPCYVVQEGVMSLAQVTGLPIVPVSYHVNWKIRVNSWDRFQIPLPFSRCEMIYAKPIFVPREATCRGVKNCGCSWKRNCAPFRKIET